VTLELPLFPLKTVLFPGGSLALRIFEPRYLDMIARVLRSGGRFGVLAIRSGSEVGDAETFDVGTTAEIVDWDRQADGLLGIRARGCDSFRLEHATRRADGLYVGRVALLDRLPPTRLPDGHAALAALLDRVLAESAGLRPGAPELDDAEWVGARLAEILPLELTFRQELLEARDALTRLERIAAALRPSAPAEP
jgi:Lon protease-like protein